MKQPQNPRRGRSRTGPGKRHMPSKNRNFESGGGEAKVRGNAQQILDKYQAMARDAASAGEHIQAEGYWQHAEHYYRILNADRDDRPVVRDNHVDQNENDNSGNAPDTGHGPQNEQPVKREIPIEARDQSRNKAPVENTPENHRMARNTSAEPAHPVKPATVEVSVEPTVVPAFQQADEQVSEQAAPEGDKPKRRGRPRKVASQADTSSETPDTDPSQETVSV